MQNKREAFLCLTDASVEKYYKDGAYAMYYREFGEKEFHHAYKEDFALSDLIDATCHGFEIIAVKNDLPTTFNEEELDLVEDTEYEKE